MPLICATAFNRPDFIELQYRLFARVLEDDYEFCIVSDADTVERRDRNQGDVRQARHRLPSGAAGNPRPHREALEVTAMKYQQGHEFFCPYRYAPAALQNFDDLSGEAIARRLVARSFTPAEVDLALQSPYTIELLGENQFRHYRAGTNYENYSEAELAPKDKVLLEFFDRIVSE